jgi:serine/threonine protein kinase
MYNYEISSLPIDIGSFGSVHKAIRKQDGKVFCLKRSKNIINENEFIMFHNESQLMKECDHPNLIEFIESFNDEQKFCIVMNKV